MNPDRTYVDYLEDMHEAIHLIAEFTQQMTFEQFKTDTKTSFAVVRALEVIGEAAKRIPDSVRKRYPDVPLA